MVVLASVFEYWFPFSFPVSLFNPVYPYKPIEAITQILLTHIILHNLSFGLSWGKRSSNSEVVIQAGPDLIVWDYIGLHRLITLYLMEKQWQLLFGVLGRMKPGNRKF